MSYPIRVDREHTGLSQKFPHGALPGGQTAPERPTLLLSHHSERQ
jgi:hypothetical protein